MRRGRAVAPRIPAVPPKIAIVPLVPHVTVALITAVFALGCVKFVWQPGLGTFADDSVSYLVMAQVFSPWQPASQAVAEAFSREAFYPPLFPLLLALTGAGHHSTLAHAVNALLLAACLPLVYVLALRWLGDRWAAASAAVATALLPSLWIHVRGILSEPLFGLILLATLRVLEVEADDRRRLPTLTFLMSALVLTRTVGLPVIGAYALWAMTRRTSAYRARVRAVLPALAAAAAYAVWIILRPAATSDDNLVFAFIRAGELLGALDPVAALAGGIATQANAMAEAWAGALLLFWVEGQPVRPILASVVGLLSLAGIASRIAAGKADGWMTAAYLATFLLWPFQEQMTRFLFPVLPLLVLYAFWALAAALRRLGKSLTAAAGLLGVALVSLAMPGLAFIQQRASTAGGYADIIDWYRTPDLAEARRRSEVQLGLFADVETIRTLTRPGDRVMWVVPAYIALLADRRGVAAPPTRLAPAAYRLAVREAKPDYIFLSTYHPRDTMRDTAWRAGNRALEGYGEVVHVRRNPADGEPASVLLKIDAIAHGEGR